MQHVTWVRNIGQYPPFLILVIYTILYPVGKESNSEQKFKIGIIQFHQQCLQGFSAELSFRHINSTCVVNVTIHIHTIVR